MSAFTLEYCAAMTPPLGIRRLVQLNLPCYCDAGWRRWSTCLYFVIVVSISSPLGLLLGMNSLGVAMLTLDGSDRGKISLLDGIARIVCSLCGAV